MKYILTLLSVFCSMLAFAQNNYLIPHQEKMMDGIIAAQYKYEQDSLQIVKRAAAELKASRESLCREVIREKEHYTSNVIKTFSPTAELKNVESFLVAFMSQSNDPSQYLSLKEDIRRISSQLEGRSNETFVHFSNFLADLEVLEKSVFILNNLSTKDVVSGNLSAINKAKFYKPEQVKSIEPIITSLKKYNSAKMYLNSVLTTIKDSYDTFKSSGDMKEPSENINDELASNITVSTISSVPCMEKIYKRVTSDVLVYNDDKSFNFEKFNVRLLEELIKELE